MTVNTVTYIKKSKLKPTRLGLLFAIAVSSGCTSTNHKPVINSTILTIGSVKSTTYTDDRPVSLIAGSKAAGYLMCFYQNQRQSSIRLYPNRFSKGAYISESTIINLSGEMPFKLTNTTNKSEKVACFLTLKEVHTQLPDTLKQPGYSPTSYDINKITTIFKTITKDNYHYAEVIL